MCTRLVFFALVGAALFAEVDCAAHIAYDPCSTGTRCGPDQICLAFSCTDPGCTMDTSCEPNSCSPEPVSCACVVCDCLEVHPERREVVCDSNPK
jgi:hypothetical protein